MKSVATNMMTEMTTEMKTETMTSMPLLDQYPIFDLIMMHQSCRGVSGDNGNGALADAHYISTHRTIYIPYKDPIKDVS